MLLLWWMDVVRWLWIGVVSNKDSDVLLEH